MDQREIARQRLAQQGIATAAFDTPGQVVTWLGAVQAQDYLGSLWALGLRMVQASEPAIEQAILDKTIIRTWFMRGTLHFVPAADLRWMLALMAPNMRRLVRTPLNTQQIDLSPEMIIRSFDILAQRLSGGRHATRDELAQALEQAGIATQGIRFMVILQMAQTEGLICQAPRRGKQFTFALLDEWLPAGPVLAPDEALAELTRRYFTSHGPATLQDYAWWSGFSLNEARRGLELARPHLAPMEVDGRTYWHVEGENPPSAAGVALLPAFDEFLVSYKDRQAALAALPETTRPGNNVILGPVIVQAGQVVGAWRRTFVKGQVKVAVEGFVPLDEAALEAAVRRYGIFLGMEAQC